MQLHRLLLKSLNKLLVLPLLTWIIVTVSLFFATSNMLLTTPEAMNRLKLKCIKRLVFLLSLMQELLELSLTLRQDQYTYCIFVKIPLLLMKPMHLLWLGIAVLDMMILKCNLINKYKKNKKKSPPNLLSLEVSVSSGPFRRIMTKIVEPSTTAALGVPACGVVRRGRRRN